MDTKKAVDRPQEMQGLITEERAERKPVGLCLSGGGALGFAHIGALQALLEAGIEPQVVSGSSIGAIVGALYAAGIYPPEMMKILEADRLYRVTKIMTFKPTFWKSGWSDHSTVLSLIREVVPHNCFEKLQRKLFVCVSNLNTAQWEIVNSGHDLNAWVSASSGIPGVFEAYEHNGNFYVDGGLLNNLPAQPLKEICDRIIGIDVLPYKAPSRLKMPIDAIAHSIRAVQSLNSAEGRSLCWHIIEPQVIKRFHEFRFDAYKNIYKQGYKDAMEYIRQHPDILE